MVKQHHPDRGGDSEHFKKINEAYDVLKDPQTRQQYDNPQPQYHFRSSDNFQDVMNDFFGGGIFRQSQMKNRDIKLAIQITLEEVATGKDAIARYSLLSGETTSTQIHIPPGVENGDAVRFPGLGDNYHQQIPPGDLYVYVKIQPHSHFLREGKHLRANIKASVFELILGKKVNIKTLQGKQITVNVPAGTNPGTILSVPGYGLPDRKGNIGNLLLTVKAETPKIKDPEILERIKKLNDEISTST